MERYFRHDLTGEMFATTDATGLAPNLEVTRDQYLQRQAELEAANIDNPLHHLQFRWLRAVNVARCESAFFPLEQKDGPWWGNAMAGEAGEACNVVKKIDRDGMTPELLEALALELADVVTYADLLAARFGIDLGDAVVRKFNIVSDRRACGIRLPENK